MADQPATYRIRDWKRHYESAESKKIRALAWVKVPNKHDGKGYRRLVRQKQAVELFAAWVLTVQVASKCPERGTLCDDDGPLKPEDLAYKTGFPPKIFERLWAFATLPEIGWMEVVSGSIRRSPDDLPEQPDEPGDHPGQIRGDKRRVEEKREEKKREDGCAEPSASAPAVLTFPTKGGDWALTQSHIGKLAEAHPALDVVGECRKALLWIDTNPGRRKTTKGMPAFLARWMGRAADALPSSDIPIARRKFTPEEDADLDRHLREAPGKSFVYGGGAA